MARASRGAAWEVETGAAPAAERPRATPRPPKWSGSAKATYGRGVRRTSGRTAPQDAAGIDQRRLAAFHEKQLATLKDFQAIEASGEWSRLHRAHFDWWMFPIDDGSKPQFNVESEADVEKLRSDPGWLSRYREAVRLVAMAWGWDLAVSARIEPLAKGMGYTDWDVRLAKICRSLYIFEEEELLASMQVFAREMQRKEKGGRGFFYGMVCLDELLYFELPRLSAAVREAAVSRELPAKVAAERPVLPEPEVSGPESSAEPSTVAGASATAPVPWSQQPVIAVAHSVPPAVSK